MFKRIAQFLQHLNLLDLLDLLDLFVTQYSKVAQSWVLKQIREPKDRLYIQHLMDEVMYIQNSNEKYELPKLENIPKTIAQIEKPNKEEAIKNIRTRFSV